jgi:phage/plasmid-associated DNA primase
LEGKKVNIDSDIPSRGLGGDEVDMLKRLTGGDTVQVDVKYQSPFDLDNTAKLAFGANEPPRFYGATGAIARRLLPIEFPFNFVNDPADDDPAQKQRRSESALEAELFTDDELDGLLRKALAGLARVEANDQFSIEARGTRGERFAEYMAQADSIVGFATDCLTNEDGRAMPNEVVHSAYVRWCQANDRSAADKRTLFKKLRSETGVDIHKKRTRADIGENQTAWYSDRLWITDGALPYLTRGAREDIETLVRHRYGSAADYVADYLLQSVAPDDADGDDADDSRPSQLDLMRALTEAVSDADSDGVARIEVIADLDKRGYDPERVRGAIDKWLSDGTLISADGGDGEYIKPGQ